MAKTPSDPQSEKPRKWTVMVYMAAGNTPELDAVAVQDIREMERGVNDDTHVVLQINRAWPDSFQRYEVRKSKSVFAGVDRDATDMGDGKTLTKFLQWAVARYPAERYFLVLWGHSYGLGFGRDHNDALTIRELQSALDDFRTARNEMLEDNPALKTLVYERYAAEKRNEAEADGRLELLGANACALSYIEAAYELKDSADYMVASQISVPFAGWPYESILKRITPNMKTEDVGALVVDTYVSHFNNSLTGERVAMSLLGLAQAEPFKELIGRLTEGIKKEALIDGKFSSSRMDVIHDVFIGAAVGDVRPLIDLRDLCSDFLDAESEDLRQLGVDMNGALDKLVNHHDGHPDLDDLKGVGIFAPFVTDDGDLHRLQLLDVPADRPKNGEAKKLLTGKDEYRELQLFKGIGDGQSWPRLVYDDLHREISTELITCITGIDATRREDRRDVTQIILGIDSAFNKLDRILTHARQQVGQDLRSGKGSTHLSPGGTAAVDVTRRFGPPFLKLIQPVDIETQLDSLRQHLALDALNRVARGEAGATDQLYAMLSGAGVSVPALSTSVAPSPKIVLGAGDPELVKKVVGFFAKVEDAIGEAERATRRGLTHGKLGLGPLRPTEFGLDDQPKSGFGLDDPPKSGFGLDDPPKSGFGLDDPPKSGFGDGSSDIRSTGVGGDLRVDRALTRVADLFRQVAQSFKDLEQATLGVEITARTVLSEAQEQHLSRKDLLAAAAQEIGRAFGILEEASTSARRTVRRVLGHPVYGIGPGGAGIGLEERLALAGMGGLDRRNLRLL